MKITVIGMIKNAADIIETYIRANGVFADDFVLIDNSSNDNTLKIINSLVAEGYKIEVISDNENAYLQSMKMNILIRYVVSHYDSDWIIPLDDDEILVSASDKNVRDSITGWDKNKSYIANWRIYVPTESDDINDPCIISRQLYAFSDGLCTTGKIIFSRNTAANEDFKIVQGNHDFIGVESEKEKQSQLFIAHYPVRSKEQILSKALVGWTNYLACPYKTEGNGCHWKQIRDTFLSDNTVSMEFMWQACMLYLDQDKLNDIKVEYKTIFIEREAFEIKYTTLNEVDYFKNFLINAENLAISYADLKNNNI